MDIPYLLRNLTVEEKVALCSGADFWHTEAVERLGITALMMSDGPHGLRTQKKSADHLGLHSSIPAVCFPAGCAMASSFDGDLLEKVGQALGDECLAEGVGLLLGPAINIKRSPLCGRNFEYLSEDPYLAGELSVRYVKGVQSLGVGTSVKHYLANNQETRRMSSSSNVSERALREIYMAAFERTVKQSQPWTIMCSYNRLNGEYVSESKTYLTDVLRGEWGYEGAVVSDWGAVNDRIEGIKAGMDLEMPSSDGISEQYILESLENGRLSMDELDTVVARILNLVAKWQSTEGKGGTWDKEAHHQLAREVSGECSVLLKNNGVLPLKDGVKVVVIGEFAEKPRIQGGGSSHINAFKVSAPLESLRAKGCTYSQGYAINSDTTDPHMLAEAVAAAKAAEVAVIFAGLPDSFESEGYDRTHLDMPANQNELIAAVAAVQPNTVVVLFNGSPVTMPWVDDVAAVLEMYLPGQAAGLAACDLLYGSVNPSGHLAETFPLRLEDNPSYLNFPGYKDEVDYREDIYVGYRYYDKKKMPVLFPFGHGLSYTTFRLGGLRVDKDNITEEETLKATVTVTNAGGRAGKAVVQLYVGRNVGEVNQPVKQLKGFAKVLLQPGESREVTFTLDRRSFAYFSEAAHDWRVESGEYVLSAGFSSEDIAETAAVQVTATKYDKQKYHANTLLGDLYGNAEAMAVVRKAYQAVGGSLNSGDTADDDGNGGIGGAMLDNMPLRGVQSFSAGKIGRKEIDAILKELNSIEGKEN